MPPTVPLERVANPLDVVEQIIASNDWSFDRRGECEIAADVPGRWSDYLLYFNWSAELSAMHFTCAFELAIPKKRRGALYELLALANERLWIGHFGADGERGGAAFHHSVLLRGASGASSESIEDMVDIALSECDRFFPAFVFTLNENKAPADALEGALLECAGEA